MDPKLSALTDPFAGETWPMLRVGQLTSALSDLQTPHHRVVVAGSDYANGWAGFIDGAIESGMRAARIVGSLSAAATTAARPPVSPEPALEGVTA